MRLFLRAGCLAAALTACDITDPNGLCACSPALPGVGVIYGEVVGPDGHLVENARVNAHLVSDAPCGTLPPTLQPPLLSTSGGAGQFRYALAWSAPTSKCWALWAAPPDASGFSASDTAQVMVTYGGGAPQDSARVRLQLR